MQKIIHIDMDCFYAAVEIRNNPSLSDKPVAVGGLPQQRGVLTTCNYIARKFGLHSAMSSAQAVKLCPSLILIPPNFLLYKQVSQQIHQIFHRYTDIIEPISLDEAYLDITHSSQCCGSATWIAQEIRAAILNELHLTASAGVAPLKFLAKIASDQNKPNGLFVITPAQVPKFIQQLPLNKIPGVGKVTTQKLQQMGLHTCYDVQQSDLALLLHQFGKIGQRIWDFSHGIDERKVEPQRGRKSVGIEITLLKNIAEIEQAYPIMDKLYTQFLQRIVPYRHLFNEKSAKLGIKLKFDDFQVTTLEKSAVVFCKNNFIQLLQQIWQRKQGRSVRLIGLHLALSDLKEKHQHQMSLW